MTAPRLTPYGRSGNLTLRRMRRSVPGLPLHRMADASLPSPRERIRTRRIARSPWRRPSNRIQP